MNDDIVEKQTYTPVTNVFFLSSIKCVLGAGSGGGLESSWATHRGAKGVRAVAIG